MSRGILDAAKIAVQSLCNAVLVWSTWPIQAGCFRNIAGDLSRHQDGFVVKLVQNTLLSCNTAAEGKCRLGCVQVGCECCQPGDLDHTELRSHGLPCPAGHHLRLQVRLMSSSTVCIEAGILRCALDSDRLGMSGCARHHAGTAPMQFVVFDNAGNDWT